MRWRATLIALGIIAVCFGLWWWHTRPPHPFLITFFSIGQGDAALIEFGNNETALVDCGPDRAILGKLGRTLPLLSTTLTYLIVTHPDRDHYGGCVDVLNRYHIAHIIINGGEKPYDPYWQEWNKKLHEESAEIFTVDTTSSIVVNDSVMEFLAPDKNIPLLLGDGDSNNRSVVFRLSHHGSSTLFTGDMETLLEQALVNRYCSPSSTPCPALQANVLKVGHHGSDSGSTPEFLQAVGAETAIVSVGSHNNYGHPSRRVLHRLERTKAQILRTDELGDILIP